MDPFLEFAKRIGQAKNLGGRCIHQKMEHSFCTFGANTRQSAKVPKDPWNQFLGGLGKGIFRARCSAQLGFSGKGFPEPQPVVDPVPESDAE
jgi:hypothetical protein